MCTYQRNDAHQEILVIYTFDEVELLEVSVKKCQPIEKVGMFPSITCVHNNYMKKDQESCWSTLK